jgi:Phage capsid protein
VSTSIDQAFVKQFEGEVFTAFQRMGSKLRGTIRTTTIQKGADTTFFKVGKGSASTKSRHGVVPVMNASHSNVNVAVADYYAGDWVDKLDLLKTNVEERGIVASAGAYALGRKIDELIVAALATTTNSKNIAAGGTGLDKTKALKVFENFNTLDIPDDGRRFAVVGPQQWNNLLAVTEFSSADYVGYDSQPWAQGLTAKRWLGVWWFMFTGLTLATTTRTCFAYHSSAAGHAIGAEIMTDVTWHGDRAAWFVNNMMSMGAVKIDDLGIMKVDATET